MSIRFVKNSANFKRRSKRSRRGRRGFAALLLLLAIAQSGVAPSGRAAPPVWSDGDLSRLRADLRETFAPPLNAANGWSLVVLASDGRMLFGDRADRAVTPASTLKLIVAAAGPATLGPQFRFHTLLAATAPIDANGVLNGDLYLAGSGDPSLVSDDLRGGVARLAQAGVRRIAGHVVVDASAIAGPEINPYWDRDDANEGFNAPTSAISLDQDTVEFHITGASAGMPADVTYVPAGSTVRFSGSVATVDGQAPSDVVVSATQTPNTFRVSGQIQADTQELFWVPIHNVPRYAGSVLERMLRDRGIGVESPAHFSATPLEARILWDHRSQPLRDIIRRMLLESNNHFAEQLLRTLGGALGEPDDRGGAAAERAFLATNAVPVPGLHLADGSGLAHADRTAAITLARVLLAAQAGESDLYDLLPPAGSPGPLRHYNFGAGTRVRAKSGHLFGVESLAGYVDTRRHGRIVFAFIVNTTGDAHAAIVQAVERLAAM
jgi:D-alanyl-D-alanine carboxypeptidase/D-alanyl-D-alanine-endopeptidase (penicillin-binding protein 4)